MGRFQSMDGHVRILCKRNKAEHIRNISESQGILFDAVEYEWLQYACNGRRDAMEYLLICLRSASFALDCLGNILLHGISDESCHRARVRVYYSFEIVRGAQFLLAAIESP